MFVDKRPNIHKLTIPASGKFRGRVIECDLARSLTVTGRCTYNASGTVGMKVNLYYSPDGDHFDTVAYTSFVVDLTAGATVQESSIIDPPETGYMSLEVENQDTVYTLTDVYLWVNASRYWEDLHKAVDKRTKRS